MLDRKVWIGIAVTEILVHGQDVTAALQVDLPLQGQVCAASWPEPPVRYRAPVDDAEQGVVVGPHDADLQEVGGVRADLGSGVAERGGEALAGLLLHPDVDVVIDTLGQDLAAAALHDNARALYRS